MTAERGDKAAEPYMAAERAVRLLVTAGWLQKGGTRLLSLIWLPKGQ